ncbi:hypothetical protein [Streptomyces sp. NPDC017260]|uniref:hypothetical protein n=1 Tax=unclassified Streptomyces TaxID=2593676 RepID=UPI0037AB89D2
MVDQTSGDDMRLLSFAYVESLLNEDKGAARYLERDSKLMVRSVGGLAFFLMDAVVIPVENGIGWTDGWVEVDFKARIDPGFKANLIRRGQYRRLARGFTVRPKRRLRRAARECVDMLCVAFLVEHGKERSATRREAALEMVGHFRERLCHSGDAQSNT